LKWPILQNFELNELKSLYLIGPQQVAKTRKYVYSTGHRSQSSEALYIVMTVS
jgi:hypothetical protein